MSLTPWWFVVLSAALIGCHSPADQPLTKDNLAAIAKTRALTGEEYQLLMGYELRTGWSNAMSGKYTGAPLDSNITIRAAIEAQRKWFRDDSVKAAASAATAAAALKRYEEETAKLRALITVTPVKKSFAEYDYQSFVRFQMVAKNNGPQAVRGFKGHVLVTDLFGDVIARLEVKEDELLAAGAERVFSTSYGYNQFMDRDTKLRFTDFEKMKFQWQPETVLLADGTSVSVPELPDP